MSEAPFERAPVVAIWGVGLIGGSLGMAWKITGAASKIIGIGREPLFEAVELGAIDTFTVDPAEALAEADVVILACPVGSIIEQAATHARFVKPGAVVTDVGSTKAAIVRAWDEHLPEGAAFVGGHPMFGREVTGVANALPSLPRGSRWILTPGRHSSLEAVGTITKLAESAGAMVRVMSPEEHDRRVALVSHLPQLTATALAASVLVADRRQGGGALELAATGFRDTTRLAGSPADLWLDILMTNAGNIRDALHGLRSTLDALDSALEQGDTEALEALFIRANGVRKLTR